MKPSFFRSHSWGSLYTQWNFPKEGQVLGRLQTYSVLPPWQSRRNLKSVSLIWPVHWKVMQDTTQNNPIQIHWPRPYMMWEAQKLQLLLLYSCGCCGNGCVAAVKVLHSLWGEASLRVGGWAGQQNNSPRGTFAASTTAACVCAAVELVLKWQQPMPPQLQQPLLKELSACSPLAFATQRTKSLSWVFASRGGLGKEWGKRYKSHMRFRRGLGY